MSTTSVSSNVRCVADALSLGSLSDDLSGVDAEHLRNIYRHARGQDGRRVLFVNDPTFARDWINLACPHADALISVFVPLDGADNLKQARRMAQANLESQPWNDVFGIEAPPLTCRVKVHGAKWGMRFQSTEPAMRGREVLNEELPPIPGDVGPCRSESAQQGQAPSPPTQTTACAAADVLRGGGLPA